MKLVWLTVVVILVQGCCCSNSTEKISEINATLSTTLPNEKTPVEKTTSRKVDTPAKSQNPVVSEKNLTVSTNHNQTDLEIFKIFSNITNTIINVSSTLTTDSLNVTSVNSTEEVGRNDTFSTNSTMTGAVASSDDVLPFRLPNWAAVAAGVSLISAVIGYISCVSYRRFLQRKYGNSQILIGEDVYDTSDLRNFEI